MVSQEKVKLVRELVDKASLQEFMFHHDKFTKGELFEIFYILKKQGYRVFEGNSELGKTFINLKEYKKQNFIHDSIITTSRSKKVIFSADSHLCHVNDCVPVPGVNYLDYMGDYANENDVEDIIFLGDGIEGVDYVTSHPEKNRELKINPSREEQLEYVRTNFIPEGNYIIHVLAGNHCIYTKSSVVYDFWKDFINYSGRKDIVITGYEIADLRINNDKIRLIHRCIQKNKRRKQDPFFQFSGGSHTSKLDTFEGVHHRLYVPPISRISHNKPSKVGEKEVGFYSGFVTTDFEFNENGKIETSKSKFFKFDDLNYGRIVPVTDDEYDDLYTRDFQRVRK